MRFYMDTNTYIYINIRIKMLELFPDSFIIVVTYYLLFCIVVVHILPELFDMSSLN